jgi:hypothetical protein
MGLTSGQDATDCADRRRLLVLYDHHWLPVKTHRHYLESFHRYSDFAVSYATCYGPCPYDLDYFDAVVIHHSVKVCYPGYLSRSYARALRRYRGLKVLFLQDEYEATDAACAAIDELGIGVVFSVVPEPSIPAVYAPKRFPQVTFVSVLTGYVPLDIDAVGPMPAMRDRPLLIAYRGRDSNWWYGDLYQEKVAIGRRMKEICDARGLATDIAWREDDRIYGDAWFRFLGSARATLGTESGANVFDRDGTLALQVQRELAVNPGITYADVHAKYLKEHEGRIVMNQVSPKIFEAIACRTALVLFEGRYSGVIEPERHFITLKKDFSNVDDVLRRLDDIPALEALTRRAYDDVIASGRYSYRSFVAYFDRVVQRHLPAERRVVDPWLPLPPCDALPACRAAYAKHFGTRRLARWLDRDRLKRLWVRAPGPVRWLLQPALERVRVLLRRG